MASGRQSPVLLRIEEAARQLGIGRTLTYELISRGELEVVRIGRATRVPAAAVHEFVDRLRVNGLNDGR